jgi:septum formation protein
MKPSLVLASASRSRQTMLRAAGVRFIVDPANVNENAVKETLEKRGADAAMVAEALAVKKAEEASNRHPDALVIGSDQMLFCEGGWFDKPLDRAAARDQLIALRGRAHTLTAAVTVMCGGRTLWRHIDEAELVMRAFSETFLDEYLDRVGADALISVGAYQVEGQGIQLFETIRGDIFTIMGMPLLPLLGFLRDEGVLVA